MICHIYVIFMTELTSKTKLPMKIKTNPKYLKFTQNWHNLLQEGKASEITNLLTSGFSFNLSKKEFEDMLERNPTMTHLHYYFGIDKVQDEFVVLIIDNVSDAQGNHENVYVRTLKNKLPTDAFELLQKPIKQMPLDGILIPIEEALHRSFRWNLFCQNWLEYKINQTQERGNTFFFPLIANPIEGIQEIFKLNSAKQNAEGQNIISSNYAHHMFGLKLLKVLLRVDGIRIPENLRYQILDMKYYMVDIIVTNITDAATKGFADHSCICDNPEVVYKDGKYSLLPMENPII